jgi:hypothetical protein
MSKRIRQARMRFEMGRVLFEILGKDEELPCVVWYNESNLTLD